MGFKIENNNTCRVCLKTKNNGIFSIYEKMSEEYTEPIFSMIIYCASVNVSYILIEMIDTNYKKIILSVYLTNFLINITINQGL